MRRTRRTTIEEGAFCSACNVYTIGQLVRLEVRPDMRGAVWLCLPCLRHMTKCAAHTKSVAGGGK